MVIYNPVDIEEVIKKSEEEVEDLVIDDEKIKIICVGSFVKSKGHRYLIEAIKILTSKKTYKMKVYFIGTGSLMNQLKNMVEMYQLDDIIEFLGYKDNPFKYMRNSDIFVLPSIWEGFGNVIVEAMACNIPVISTTCESGPKEIITNNENGILVKPKDPESLAKAIENIITDTTLKKKIINNGFERAKYFELTKITREYEKHFLSIIN